MICRQLYRARARVLQTRSLSEAVAAAPKSDGNARVRHTKLDVAQNEARKSVNVHEAVQMIREHSWAKFDETIELSVNLNLDPRKPNQAVKGVAKLPSGTGKVVRVGVFAVGKDADAAMEAGADVVGGEDLMLRVQKGEIPFDSLIATPEMMGMVGKIGRVLGPRGLMPNPKLGTVTRDVAAAVKSAKEGRVQFRVEKKGIVQAGMGKLSFSNDAIIANIRAFMVAVSNVKPETLKGKYMKSASICTTMGPGINIDLATVDPSNAKFMLTPDEITG
jgi:large subunit ribosomal protein L1